MIEVSRTVPVDSERADEGVSERVRPSEDDFERRDDSWVECSIFTRFKLIAARPRENSPG
jgi:hypothetical protein